MKSIRQLVQSAGPYLAAVVVLLLLRSTGLAQTLDLVLYDLITSQRAEGSGQDTPITLVGIEEDDIKRFGWPIDDGVFCEAFDALNAAGVVAIGFDIYRDKGVGPNQKCLRDRFRDEPTLVSIFNVASDIPPVPGTPPERQSYNDISVDADGVLRRDLVHVTGQDEATVSFPMRVLEVATGDTVIRSSLETETHEGAWLSVNGGGYHNEIEAAWGYQRLMRFREPGSYPSYSLTDLVDGSVPEEKLRNRIVLIGSTAASLRDLFEVPHTRYRQGETLFQISGVEMHANRLATLIDERNGTLIQGWIMPGWGNLLLVLGFAASGLLLGERIPKQRVSILVVVLLAGSAAGGFGLLLWNHIWAGIAMPIAALLSFGGAAWLRRGVESQQHSQQIRQLLGQTTSPAVAEQLWAQRDALLSNGRFMGQQLPITSLFTDTASFTSVSEGMSPRELMDWLNRGMEVCVPAVTQRNGMVNKFTGDGMLAVFGVPLPGDPSAEAQAAVEAAIEINNGLERLNAELIAEGAPTMRVRMGIHSGEALVGSMGSAERIEYAVIGDAVNCASRLESYDKHRHEGVLRVLLSSTTLELLPTEFRASLSFEDWGPVQVKGRDKPLKVSELKFKGSSTQAAESQKGDKN
ncbi:MAG: CHASE2 domain-containing protein [Synechococcus sp.]|uniref:CHASE2 domain-containing protein n=1 Tax=Synechococcus sp. A15-44 TaxID=1050646 RepID=UPI00164920FB|nr:adenylate/guanylate cyclase domain-containing protein [Synechococcus sp. A15-44]QNI65299.1 adenylate cyclase [Synechococcus sp. A15-44]